MRIPAPLLLLVVASGAGLLGLGVVGLWRGARDVEARARVEAREEASRVARVAREQLTDPAFLDALAGTAFAVARGELVVPEDLGWIDVPPVAAAPPSPLPLVELSARAREAEFVGGDAAVAAALHARASELADLSPAQRAEARLAAAWCAHRADDAALRDAHLQALDSAAMSIDAQVSRLLLRAAAQRPVSVEDAACLRRLPAAAARAVVDRLAERSVDPSAFEAAIVRVERRRAALRRVRSYVSRLRAATGPAVVSSGSECVVFTPSGAAGGRGVMSTPTSLAASLRRALRASLGETRVGLVIAEGVPADDAAVAVVDGLSVTPAPIEAGAWSRPWGLTALLAALALCFGLGSFLAFRAVRREAAAMRARAEFLTSVTHELKTPLASIRLLAEMLEDGRVPAERRSEYYALLAGESVRLGALIENVLDLGRLERGERSYDRRPQDPADVVRTAVELFTPLAERDGLRVEAAVRDDGASAAFDRGALEQALLNVMDNARKYAGDGGVLSIDARRENGCYEMRVRDRGPGVDPAEREAIFARFVRGAEQRDGSVPGVGLGLHLSRRILRDHGGDLVCEGPVDGGPGACFVLTLPVGDPAAAGEGEP